MGDSYSKIWGHGNFEFLKKYMLANYKGHASMHINVHIKKGVPSKTLSADHDVAIKIYGFKKVPTSLDITCHYLSTILEPCFSYVPEEQPIHHVVLYLIYHKLLTTLANFNQFKNIRMCFCDFFMNT